MPDKMSSEHPAAEVWKKIELAIKDGNELSRNIDGYLIGLSGGAMGFSMAFAKDLAPNKLYLEFLFAAWACFAMTMLCVVASNVLAKQNVNDYLQRLAQIHQGLVSMGTSNDPNARPRVIESVSKSGTVQKLNWGAVVCQGLGLASLGIFVGMNLLG